MQLHPEVVSVSNPTFLFFWENAEQLLKHDEAIQHLPRKNVRPQPDLHRQMRRREGVLPPQRQRRDRVPELSVRIRLRARTIRRLCSCGFVLFWTTAMCDRSCGRKKSTFCRNEYSRDIQFSGCNHNLRQNFTCAHRFLAFFSVKWSMFSSV